MRFAGTLDQNGKGLEVGFPVLDFFIDNDSVESLFTIEELFSEVQSEVGSDSHGKEGFLRFEFRAFDSLGYFNFLFSGQKGDLPHLLEIHANGIVQYIVLTGLGLGFFLFFLFGLERIDFIGIEDVDLQVLQNRDDIIDIVLTVHSVRQRRIDIAVGEIALFFGLPNQVANAFVYLMFRQSLLGFCVALFLAWHKVFLAWVLP